MFFFFFFFYSSSSSFLHFSSSSSYFCSSSPIEELGVNGGPLRATGDVSPHPSVSAAPSGSGQPQSLTMEKKRDVTAAMSSPSVIKALDMGIPKEAIEVAVKERLLAGNGMFMLQQERSFFKS